MSEALLYFLIINTIGCGHTLSIRMQVSLTKDNSNIAEGITVLIMEMDPG